MSLYEFVIIKTKGLKPSVTERRNEINELGVLLTCATSPNGLNSARSSSSVHANDRLRRKSREVSRMVVLVGSSGGAGAS